MIPYHHSFISLRRIGAVVLLVHLLLPTHLGFAKGSEPGSSLIMDHVQDTHVWHLATVRDTRITIPLAPILYARGTAFSTAGFATRMNIPKIQCKNCKHVQQLCSAQEKGQATTSQSVAM